MIYWNGKIVSPEIAAIAPTDRGFLLGDGLFETMRAYEGRIFALREHWERLKNSADYLKIPLAISCVELEKIANELLDQNNLLGQNASLRLTLTRGSGPRGLLPPKEVQPTLILAAFPLPINLPSSINAWVVDIRRNEFSPLANIKSLNYLDNVLAKMAATQAGADEAILLNSKGDVAEACAANIFLVTEQNQLATPRLEDGALPGITRKMVIHLAKQLHIPVEEKSVTLNDLRSAHEIFLTNSLIEIQSIDQINHHLIGNKNSRPITTQLQAAYARAVSFPVHH